MKFEVGDTVKIIHNQFYAGRHVGKTGRILSKAKNLDGYSVAITSHLKDGLFFYEQSLKLDNSQLIKKALGIK